MEFPPGNLSAEALTQNSGVLFSFLGRYEVYVLERTVLQLDLLHRLDSGVTIYRIHRILTVARNLIEIFPQRSRQVTFFPI